jgi:Cu-processing system ATP-binding protein
VADTALDTDLLVKFNLASIFDKPMRTLSGGTRQKVSAALAFYFNPSILILDEPTAGLDPLSSEILKEKIMQEKKKNKLILITSHILSDLDELTTHVMYLQEGKMIFLKDIEILRKETGEDKLGRAIAGIMRGGKKEALWVNEVLAIKADED